MGNKGVKILFGLIFISFLAIGGVLLWTKSPELGPMEAWEKELEAKKTEKAQRQLTTIYILKDGYQLMPGKFDDSRKPEELMAITELKTELNAYLREGSKHVVCFKVGPESEFNALIDLLDVLSVIEKLQYTTEDISQAEIDFLRQVQK